jgi:hypothetical protein
MRDRGGPGLLGNAPMLRIHRCVNVILGDVLLTSLPSRQGGQVLGVALGGFFFFLFVFLFSFFFLPLLLLLSLRPI